MSDIIASDFDGLAVLKDLDQTIQILAWNIGPACQVAEFMGTKWLAACRELDTESTGREGRSLKFGSGTSWIAETSDIQGFKGILRSQRCLFTKLFAALWRSDLRNATTYCVGQGKVPIFNPCQSSIVESWNDCHQWFKSDPLSLSCRWRPALPNS